MFRGCNPLIQLNIAKLQRFIPGVRFASVGCTDDIFSFKWRLFLHLHCMQSTCCILYYLLSNYTLYYTLYHTLYCNPPAAVSCIICTAITHCVLRRWRQWWELQLDILQRGGNRQSASSLVLPYHAIPYTSCTIAYIPYHTQQTKCLFPGSTITTTPVNNPGAPMQ